MPKEGKFAAQIGLNKSLPHLGLDTKIVTSTLGRTSQCELSRGSLEDQKV